MSVVPSVEADSRLQVESLNRRAHALRHSDARTALALSLQARAMALRLDDQRGLAYALLRASLCQSILGGDGPEVQSLLEQALGLMRSLGDKAGEAEALNHAGNQRLGHHDHAAALGFYQASLALREALGDADAQAASLNNIALVHRRSGDLADALQVLYRAEDLARQGGDPQALTYVLSNLGRLLAELGEIADGEQRLNEALALVRQTEDRALESTLLLSLARLHQEAEQAEVALPLLRQAFDLTLATGNQGDQAQVLLALGEVQLALRQHSAARPLLDEALALAQQRGDQDLAARALLALAGAGPDVHDEPGHRPMNRLHAALAHAEAAQALPLLAHVHERLSRQAEAEGDLATALRHSREHQACMARLQGAQAQRRLRAVVAGRAVASGLAEARHSAQSREQLLAELQAQAELLQQLAREDGLTGLANRRWLDLQCRHEIERAQRFGHSLTLAMVDIDHFKLVNDQHSHAVGDAVLCRVARLLREGCRASDGVGRYGGEEFLLILVETSAEQALQRAEQLRQRIAAHDWAAMHPGLAPITASIGLAELAAGDGPAALLQRADECLYRAKRAGRNQVCG